MNKLTSFIFVFAFMITISGCKNQQDSQQDEPSETQQQNQATNSNNQQPKNIPIACKKPVAVADIWQLEPMLTKKGVISASMSKDEKEKLIKAFIAKKNSQYQICLKGK
jgi:hypothetical protein